MTSKFLTPDVPQLRFEAGVPAFSSGDEFYSTIDAYGALTHEQALEAYAAQSAKTLYTYTAFQTHADSVNGDYGNSLQRNFLATDPIDGNLFASDEVLRSTQRVVSEEGFAIIGKNVGYFSANLQVFAPKAQFSELREAIMSSKAEALANFGVIYDRRSNGKDATSRRLTSRSNEETYTPECPWAMGNTETRTNTNRSHDGDRQVLTQWYMEVTSDNFGFPVRIRRNYVIYGKSYKRTFVYKTVHNVFHDLTWSIDDGNGVRTLRESLTTPETREVLDVTTFVDRRVNNQTEANQTIGRILSFSGQNTRHSHRGMDGEYNYLLCP